MRIGSMFSGYGGLDIAVEAVFNAETIWHAEWEDAPSKILAAHWPDVHNYRDVTAVDWKNVPPVDIITGGFPCQDVSLAGRRAGMTEGTRSNLWGAMRTAIETIQPRYVVAENVRGLLSAKAYSDSDMEPGEGSLGDDGPPNLRAIGRVVSDLDELGYVGQWCGLRAADVGAPHGRFRVFILATRRDAIPHTRGVRGHQAIQHDGRGPQANDWASVPHQPDRQPMRTGPERGAAADTGVKAQRFRAGLCAGEPEGLRRRRPDDDYSQASTADTSGSTVGEHPGGSPAEEAGAHQSDGLGDHGGERADTHGWATLAHAESRGRRDPQRDDHGQTSGDVDSLADNRSATSGPSGSSTDWGPYAPAIRRWEQLRGPAPAPTELTVKGKHRLSAHLVEWMMGLPAGWVTDIDISRNEQLKALGNGVVPAQAATALDHMLNNT